MANFYTDNPDLRHHLTHPMMRKIVALKERDYSQAQQYDYAPVDYDDAIDNYDRVLQIVGDLCGNIIADNAADVDHDGPSVSNGRVTYAPGTIRNLEACRQAGLMGMAMPDVSAASTSPLPRISWQPTSSAVPIPGSKTFGDCKTAPRPYMNLAAKTKNSASSPAFAPAKPCLWTLPNQMQAATFRQ